GAHAVEGVVSEAELGASNAFEVHQLAERRVVRRANVGQAIAHRWIQSGATERISVQERFDALTHRRFGGPAEMGLELKSIEGRRIVAGGDHHATDGPLRLDRKGHGWRGSRLGGENDGEAVAAKDLGGTAGELIGKK